MTVGPGATQHPARPGARHDIVAVLLLGVMALGYHYREVLFYEIPRWKDNSEIFEPERAFYVRELRQGRLPVWAPHLGLGMPVLAESNLGVLYPPHLVTFSILPAREGDLLLCVLRTFAGGAFAYAFARTVGLGFAGSLLAGTVFMLNGLYTAQRDFFLFMRVGMDLPLALLLAERLVTRRRPGTVLWAALLFGVSVLAGHYQFQFIAMLSFVVYGAMRALQIGGGWRRLGGQAVRLVLPIGLGMALAAVQWLPSAELMPLTERAGAGLHQIAHAYPPYHLLGYVFPHLLTFEAETYWDLVKSHPVMTPSYVGLLPLFLATWAWRRRLPAVIPMFVLAVVFTLLSFGTWLPGYRWLVKLPGFGYFSNAAYYQFASALALGVLAGVGFGAIGSASAGSIRRWARRAGLWLVGAAVVGVAANLGLRLTVGGEGEGGLLPLTLSTLRRMALSLPWLGASALALWALARWRRGAAAVVVVVAAVDLAVWGWHPKQPDLAPPASPARLARPGPVLEHVPPAGESDLRHAGGPHSGRSIAGLPVLWFNTPFMPERCRWLHKLNNEPYEKVAHLYRAFHVGFLLAHETVDDPDLEEIYRGWDQQIYLLHGPRARVWYLYRYKRDVVLPRAFLVDRAVWCRDGEEARRHVEDTSFGAGAQVILEAPPGGAPPVPDPTGSQPATTFPALRDPPGACHIVADKPRSVRIHVGAERAAWLVLSDLAYPGWRAFVGGVETPIYQANYVCRAIRVPAGEHEVEFVYRPASLFWGQWISLATLALVLLSAGTLAVRRRRLSV